MLSAVPIKKIEEAADSLLTASGALTEAARLLKSAGKDHLLAHWHKFETVSLPGVEKTASDAEAAAKRQAKAHVGGRPSQEEIEIKKSIADKRTARGKSGRQRKQN